MFKLRNIIPVLLGAMMFALTGCHDEKELIELSGNLPFKVKAVFLVGNATPKNPTWSIDELDLLEQSPDDPFIWTYHGEFYADGRFKLCFKTSTWAQPFIHPMEFNEMIGKEPITNRPMQAPRQGGEDELWKIGEAGIYTITFNLRDFTWSSVYEGPAPVQTTGELYLIGNATPLNPTWDINVVDKLVPSESDPEIFTYHGKLREEGTFKLGMKKGTWAQPWYHPMVNYEPIGAETITDKAMQAPRQAGEDELWKCVKTGIYTLTFNTRDLTWSSVYEGEAPEEPEVPDNPIEANMVYVIGDATTAGWNIGQAFPMTRSAEDKYIFTWEGEIIKTGYLLFSLNNVDWSEMIRPIAKQQHVGTEPVNDLGFNYPNSEDNNYVMTATGRFRFTINLRKRTFSSQYIPDPIDESKLYLIGNATPKNSTWDVNNLDQLEQSSSNPKVFTYHGKLLANGTFKLCFKTGTWAQEFIHPAVNNEPIGKDPVTDKAMQAPRLGGADELWKVQEEGIYTLTFNLENNTWSSVYEGTGESNARRRRR